MDFDKTLAAEGGRRFRRAAENTAVEPCSRHRTGEQAKKGAAEAAQFWLEYQAMKNLIPLKWLSPRKVATNLTNLSHLRPGIFPQRRNQAESATLWHRWQVRLARRVSVWRSHGDRLQRS
ncbi:hypothetical protein [Aureimonas ureilytica]|uniref:hypothetical protein n=1 Tax=Aureimonas ureilytica TaxID=401562 RepID=UPI0012DC0A98|nr:hypothetical protein [Aureimonas ureilytica]